MKAAKRESLLKISKAIADAIGGRLSAKMRNNDKNRSARDAQETFSFQTFQTLSRRRFCRAWQEGPILRPFATNVDQNLIIKCAKINDTFAEKFRSCYF